jgi:hypothetical protein
MTAARKKAEEIAEMAMENWRCGREYFPFNDDVKALSDLFQDLITAALTAEREETLKDARVYMDHSPACAIAIALKQPYRGAIPECTCGLDKLLFSPAA